MPFLLFTPRASICPLMLNVRIPLSRSRVERASPRHSRGIGESAACLRVRYFLPTSLSKEYVCIYIYLWFKIVSNLDNRLCVSNKLEHVSVLSSKRLNFEQGTERWTGSSYVMDTNDRLWTVISRETRWFLEFTSLFWIYKIKEKEILNLFSFISFIVNFIVNKKLYRKFSNSTM